MNLNSRLSCLEAAQAPAKQSAVIVAVDEADFQRQFEDLWLSCQPGLLTVTGTIAGEAFVESMVLHSHEEALELLPSRINAIDAAAEFSTEKQGSR